MVEKVKSREADDGGGGDAGCTKAGRARPEDGHDGQDGGNDDVWSEACQSEDPTRVSQKDLQGFAAEAVKKFRDMQ